ncbi:MAG: histidine kinase [Bacteroidetes bacterium]|nr:histidine kinase [Bacteroidota bacterium]
MFLTIYSDFFSWISGGLFALFVIHFLLYLNNKQKFFLNYSLYSLLFFINLNLWKYEPFTVKDIFLIILPFQYIIILVYFLYSREVLNVKTLDVKWDLYTKRVVKIIFGIAALIYFSQFLVSKLIVLLLNALLLIVVLYFSVSTFKRAYKKEPKISILFQVGALSVLLLGSVTLVLSAVSDLSLSLRQIIHYQVFMYTGVAIEMISTAFILGYRITTIEAQETESNLKLSQQKVETEKLRMEALKSQMNPHFIFNMLNSINSLIIKNNVEKASDYITKFSRFIREILNSSRKNSVSLAEELAIIKLYVVLEQARIEDGFEFEIKVEDNISLDFIKVPSMFLQPFIENAIWHGLAHKQGSKKLLIKVRKVSKHFLLEVIDNGIGYQKGMEINQKRLVKSSGIGTSIVKNRLQYLYPNAETDVQIEDLTHQDFSGTKVAFKFPNI